MTIFKFLRRKQCNHKMTLYSHMHFVISEERCVLDIDHLGAHITKNGQQWVTQMARQRYLEENYGKTRE